MIIKKVRGKNFFSLGNAFVELDFTKSKRTVIVGTNGMGKSSLLNMVSFVLFGKTIKPVTKPQIVNSINGKNCVCEVEFTENGHSYLVRRGIKPNVFEIFDDGVLLDQSLVGDYQDHLEQKIIGCSFRTFMQTSIISIENYKPFMSLKPAERREFIEDILDIRVLSAISQIVKTRSTKNKEEIRVKDAEYDGIKNSLIIQKRHIDQVEQIKLSGIDQINTRISEYDASILKNTQMLDTLSSEIDTLKSPLDTLKQSKQEADVIRSKMQLLQPRIRALDKSKNDMLNKKDTQCPSCMQSVPHEHIQNIIADADIEFNTLAAEYKQLGIQLQEYDDIDDKISAINDDITIRNHKTTTANVEIASLQREKSRALDEIRKIEEADDVSQLKAEMKLTAAKALTLKDSISEIKTEQDYNLAMIELFKDSGVKSKIVDQYVPVINVLVNQYLEKLDFFVSFNLNSEFVETIKSRHRDDFTYSSFSAGERQRIDMALLFTFRQIAKLKNSFSCNLLMLDEILDASLDADGITNLLGIFDSEEFDTTNLCVISHRNGGTLFDVFDSGFRVYKDQGFTQIEEITDPNVI